MTIRPFRPADLLETAKIDKELFGKDRYPALFFRQAYDVFGDLLRVAEDGDGAIAGYTLGVLQPDRKTGWVLALAVKKRYQGQGIATLLTENLLKVLHEKGVKYVKLTVDPANEPAIYLYRKLVFNQLEEADDYFGSGEPRMVMQKDMA